MLIVLPGTIAPSRLLLDVLREQHEDRREQWKLDHAFRTKHGIPSTPDIDWNEERRRVKAIAEAVDLEDAGLVILGCQAAILSMQAAPVDPGEWLPPAGLEAVSFKPRTLAAKESKTLKAAWAAALNANDRDAVHAAEAAIVRRSIVTVGGLTVLDGDGERADVTVDDDDVIAGLRESGLLSWLLSATLYLWSLPSGKAYRSGVLLPQT